MNEARMLSKASSHPRRFSGFAYRGLLFAAPVVLALPVLAYFGLPKFSLSSEEDGPMTYLVERGEFLHDVTERGSIESASNVEIASKVKSSSGGTTILEIVPEGIVIKPEQCIPENAIIPLEELEKYEEWRKENEMEITDLWPKGYEVDAQIGDSQASESESAGAETEAAGAESEPGDSGSTDASGADEPSESADDQAEADGYAEAIKRSAYGDDERPVLTFEDLKGKMVLVKLNSASLDTRLTQQQIICEKSAADVTQAKTGLETAEISKEEYLKGTYHENKKKIEGDIFMARVYLDRAQDYLDHSKLLHAKGLISDRELQANEFDVEKKKIDLDRANTEMEVLEKYTRVKTIKTLEATIETAKARLSADEKSYELDLEELQEIEEQMVNCTIFATLPGQVVYANDREHRYSSEIVIEPGTPIRERQVIIRLPDPTQMQVKAKINEARINLVEPGMEAKIHLDAFLEQEFEGEVKEVSEYPAPTSWYSANVKEYETIISINNPPEDLRPGFTAEVQIRVARVPDVLQVPVQAVFEHGGKHYCVLGGGQEGEWEAREVQIGPTNDKQVVIEEGLKEGEEVVLNSRAHLDEVDLPELPKTTQTAKAEGSSRAAGGGPRGAAPPKPGAAKKPNAGSAQSSPAATFKRLDKDGNGKLEKGKLTGTVKQHASQIDKNKDGTIDQGELTAAASAMRRNQAQGNPPAQQGAGPGSRPSSQPRGGS
jgi:RND family efflux transporter MFP subunit